MPPRKKLKVETEPVVWSSPEEIPTPPVEKPVVSKTNLYSGETYKQDENRQARLEFGYKLSKTLVEAVKTGNLALVCHIMETKGLRSLLHFQEHKPETSVTGAPAYFPKIHDVKAPVQPVQPYFGLRELFLWNGGGSVAEFNLLVEAVQHNQMKVLQTLVTRFQFDVNACTTHHSGFSSWIRYPLLAAIEKERMEMVEFLVRHEQPSIDGCRGVTILTHPDTKVYPRGSARSRPRCDPTALSEAAARGNVPMVRLLIANGALEPESTSRPDDPFSKVKRDRRGAQTLVDFSFREALIKAFELSPNGTRGQHARVLELLLERTGKHVGNAIDVYLLDKIRRNQWCEMQVRSQYSYRNRFAEDFDFPRRGTDSEPSVRAKAVLKGLRTMPAQCYSGCLITNEKEQSLLHEKYEQWKDVLEMCGQRLAEAPAHWKELVGRIEVDTPVQDVDQAYRQRHLRLWCELFVARRPVWSKENHHADFHRYMRLYIRELLKIGSEIARRRVGGGGWKEIWDRDIMPLVID